MSDQPPVVTAPIVPAPPPDPPERAPTVDPPPAPRVGVPTPPTDLNKPPATAEPIAIIETQWQPPAATPTDIPPPDNIMPLAHRQYEHGMPALVERNPFPPQKQEN